MDDVSISNSSQLLLVSVHKNRFANYREYLAEGKPLPALPYSLTKTLSNGGSQSTTIKVTPLQGKYFKPSLTTSTAVVTPIFNTNTKWQAMNSTFTAMTDEIKNNRRNKLLDKIQAQSLPLIEMYKERHQTSALILKFLDNVSFTIANFRNPKRILNRWGVAHSTNNKSLAYLRRIGKKKISLGDKFLEYRFAWTPLYYDIEASLQAAEKGEKKFNTFKQTAGLPFYFDWSSGTDVGSDRRWYGQCGGWFGISVRYAISDSTLAGLSMITDPILTAWELMPWTWVIDRVADISSFLGRWNATVGTSFSSGCESFLRKQVLKPYADYTINETITGPSGSKANRITTVELLLAPREDIAFTRTVLTAFPTPTLEFPLKQFSKYLYLTDYAAILKQRMSRR